MAKKNKEETEIYDDFPLPKQNFKVFVQEGNLILLKDEFDDKIYQVLKFPNQEAFLREIQIRN